MARHNLGSASQMLKYLSQVGRIKVTLIFK